MSLLRRRRFEGVVGVPARIGRKGSEEKTLKTWSLRRSRGFRERERVKMGMGLEDQHQHGFALEGFC